MILGKGNGSPKMALQAAKLAVDKNALDLLLLEVGKVSIIADYFLIGTGATAVQVRAICDHLAEGLKKAGYYAERVEGYREGWWVILDYGSLVVHIFQPDARSFYDLERLWSEAPVIECEEYVDSQSLSQG
ncbi:MAG TPA: ribosome silencing factor [Candidatus Limnocylindrales bacterium]|nr:ribosome silencing factor [Candidatus Limnocylindrales bacterium]